jgi:hypothetical protein
MKTLTRYFVPAAVLIIVGLVIWTMGRLEQRSTDARKQLLTLVFDRAAADYDALEQDLRYLRAVPPLGGLDSGIREQRASSRYWRGSYDELIPKTDAAGGTTEADPALLLVAANAAYRGGSTSPNDPNAVQQLEGVISQYSDVLRKGPWQFDAAYNYEFLARRRDTLIRARSQKPAQRGRQAAAPEVVVPPHTLHGRPGDVPPGADMNEFKVIVPQRSDERREQPEAGKGGTKARKG